MSAAVIAGAALSGPPARGRPRRRSLGRLRGPVQWMAAAPVCASYAVSLWLVAAITGSLLTGPGPALMQRFAVGTGAVGQGRWWTPLTSGLFSSGLAGYVAVTLVLLAACAPMERRLGALRSAAVMVASQAVGTLVAVGVVALGARSGDIWAGELSGVLQVGATPAAVGLLMAGSRTLDPLWRRRLRVFMVVTLVTTALYAGDFSDIVRLAAAAVGLVLGTVAATPGTAAAHAAPIKDRRALVALTVAAAAFGPASTLLTASRFGPLSALNFLFLPSLDADDVVRWCARVWTTDRGECASAAAAFLVQGVGPLIQTLLPVLVLLVLAEGLRRGRRVAAIATITVNLLLAAIGAFLTRRALTDFVSDNQGAILGASEIWIIRLAPTLLPVAIAALVFRFRGAFPVRTPRAVLRRWVATVAGCALTVAALYLAVGWIVRGQFEPVPSIVSLAESLPERFAPAGFISAGHGRFFPVGGVAIVLFRWVGTLFWAAVLGATVVLFWRSRGADGTPDRSAAAAILRRGNGSGTMAYMALWRGNHYFFTPDRGSFVAYRVIAGVAITTGGPVGGDRAAVVRQFVGHCVAAGWTPCFFSVTESDANLLRGAGFRVLRVGSDTVIHPAGLTFAGKPWQHLRAAFHRAERLGVTARWSRYDDLSDAIREQVVAIDRQWLAGKELPEMGFTLGGLKELADPAVRCLLAIDDAGRVWAVTSWLPGYRDGVVVGWTLDFMRRSPDAFTGATEMLIGTALARFRDEGAEYVSLSGVPLAWPDGEGPAGPLGHAIEAMAGVLEPVYGFRSLMRFKSKFSPDYVPLYLAYLDPVALPTVTNAVLRAYVPHVGAGEVTRLLRRLARPLQ